MIYHIGRFVLSSLCVGAFSAVDIWWCWFCRLKHNCSVHVVCQNTSCILACCSSVNPRIPRRFPVLHQSNDCRNNLIYAHTTWSTFSTSDIKLGSLTLRAGDFAELILLYIFVFTALDIFRHVIVLLTAKVVRCINLGSLTLPAGDFAELILLYIFVFTALDLFRHFIALLTAKVVRCINLGSLTLPAGDFAELILLYIFYSQLSICFDMSLCCWLLRSSGAST